MKAFPAIVLLLLTAACAPKADAPRAAALTPAAGRAFEALIAQYDADIATLRRARNGSISSTLRRRLSADESAAAAELRGGGVRIAHLDKPRVVAPPARQPSAVGPQTLTQFAAAQAQRTARALELRAQQFREREADVAFDFERAHAGRRLTLELKLRALHLAAADAARYRTQLNALNRREANVVAAQRGRDRVLLAAYGALLRAQSEANVASLGAELRSQAAARSVPTPHTGAIAPQLTRDGRAAAAAAFDAARTDIQRRYSELGTANDAAQASLANEIAALEKERDALRAAVNSAQMHGATHPSLVPRSATAASASSSPPD